MPECNHNCSECGETCSERDKESLILVPHKNTKIKKIIGVISGKGGVGKSLVTSLLACKSAKEGKKVAILDADITGPSIPKMFGITERLEGNEDAILPAVSSLGIKIVSSNLLLDDPSDPIIWRGPMIAQMVKQFYTDVDYGEVDELYVDMPPGTGDVALTVFQSLKVDGIIVVTTPQDLVSMIVEKAVKMANEMNIPVIGLVENMSYVQCPKCGEKIDLFGRSHVEEVSKKYNIKIIGKIPLDSAITVAADKGQIETLEKQYL